MIFTSFYSSSSIMPSFSITLSVYIIFVLSMMLSLSIMPSSRLPACDAGGFVCKTKFESWLVSLPILVIPKLPCTLLSFGYCNKMVSSSGIPSQVHCFAEYYIIFCRRCNELTLFLLLLFSSLYKIVYISSLRIYVSNV